MRTVLVVDNDPKLLNGLVREIRRMGYHPLTATTRNGALELIRTHDIGVLLAELDVSGIELLRAARRKSPSTRTLLMSAQATPAEYALARQEGALEVLTKPISSDDFEAAFRGALDATQSRSVLHELNLVDLLQMMHLGMQSATIAIGHGSGQILMERGQVIHASYGSLIGMDAFRYMVSLKSTAIETGPLSSGEATIDAPFEAMLLNALREIDEAKHVGVPMAVPVARPVARPIAFNFNSTFVDNDNDTAPMSLEAAFGDSPHHIRDLTFDLARRPRRRVAMIAAAAVFVTVSIAAFAVIQPSERGVIRAVPDAVPLQLAPIAVEVVELEVAEPQHVVLRFEVSPRAATVRANGALVTGELVVPPSSASYVVEIAAPGHATQTLLVSAERSKTIEVVLPELKAPKARHQGQVRRSKRTIEKAAVVTEEAPRAETAETAETEIAKPEPVVQLELADTADARPVEAAPAVVEPPVAAAVAVAPLVPISRAPSDRPGHALTAARCGKCHSASYILGALKTGVTPLTGRTLSNDEIKYQVIRCMRLPHSKISKEDARIILSYLVEEHRQNGG